jgi:membrane protein
LKRLIRRPLDFFRTGIWRLRLSNLPPARAFTLRHLRIVLLSVRSFVEDRCMLRASALTFYSLLSIGPVAALVLGLAKGFGLQKRLEELILTKIPAQPEVLNQILTYARILLDNTRGSVIAGAGVTLLLWSALKVFLNLESAFNDIWQVAKPRAWRRKISNYLAFLVLAPILLLMYSSIPAFATAQIDQLAQRIGFLAAFSPLILALLQGLPYVIFWALFSMIYILIPNTRVRAGSGIIAGTFAGTVYLMVQWGLIEFQLGVTQYNPIYGSLIALPLLLLWLHLGWVIMLAGAEYSFGHQNVDLYEFEPDFINISPHLKKLLSLQIAYLLVKRFAADEPPSKALDISQRLEIPIRLVQRILTEMVSAGLIAGMCLPSEDEPIYQPASDIHFWTVTYVLDRLDHRGVDRLPVSDTESLQRLKEALQAVRSAGQAAAANRLLKDI